MRARKRERLGPDPQDRPHRRGCCPACTSRRPAGSTSAGPAPGTTRAAPRSAGPPSSCRGSSASAGCSPRRRSATRSASTPIRKARLTTSISHMWVMATSEGRRQEEDEHADVVHGRARHRVAPPSERPRVEDPQQADLGAPARGLEGERHGGAQGQQRRCRDHQQQVLDHVGLEVAHRERGHRRLQRQVDHHQAGQERGGAPPAPRAALGRQRPRRLHVPDTRPPGPWPVSGRANGPVSHWVSTLCSVTPRRWSPCIPGVTEGPVPGWHGDQPTERVPPAPIRRRSGPAGRSSLHQIHVAHARGPVPARRWPVRRSAPRPAPPGTSTRNPRPPHSSA